MRYRIGLILIATAAACYTGCGGGQVNQIRPWATESLYLPPPPPSARHTAVQSRPAHKQAASSSGVSAGARSDAQVAAELRQGFKGAKGIGSIINAATVTTQGYATVPPTAPQKVADIISAGNQVARNPYVYGGGHGGGPEGLFVDTAYDCSGSVSFALAAAGLINSPMDSTALAAYGKPGPGKWVTIYANASHAWMIVAGLRFDTVGRAINGTRWQAAARGVSGFVVRHPPGL